MPFCANCRSYQRSMFDVCEERCGGPDCRERCSKCKFLFTGELVKGSGSAEVARINRETQKEVARMLAQHADKTGGNVEVIGSTYETHIVYHPKR